MPSFFGIGLVALEIVNGGAHEFAGFFAGASGMHAVADHKQRLVRHHHLIIFHVIAHQHKNRLLRHRVSESKTITFLTVLLLIRES